MTEYNYNEIIEYIDATYDENFNNAQKWAREHGTTFAELIDRREVREVEEEYEEDGEVKTRVVEKLYRYFQIGAEPEPYVPPVPTDEQIRQLRAQYRRAHIDDKTAERSRRMANETWTAEDETAYLALDAEVTAWIEENLPYHEEEQEEPETTNTEE